MVKNSFGRDWPLENMQKCVCPGWGGLVAKLYALCEKHEVSVFQVKEKFGELRFYVDSAPMEVHDAIEQAEDDSLTICEVCGAPGILRDNHGWLSTRCEAHK